MRQLLNLAALLCAVMLAVPVGIGAAWADAEYLRLRPLKEPACASAKRGKCPLIAAPRINKRKSTIPGIRNPDYGRPPIVVMEPPRLGHGTKFRTFGGNRGIVGSF
jgi:hypothetical protein